MGQQLARKWSSDCHAVGAEDADAYGSVPSFVLIAKSIGALNWYSRRSTVPGLRRGKQELAAGTLTPSILVRIQVPQPGIPVISGVSLGLAVPYRFAPSHREPKWKWVSWGAVFATAFWLVASAAFSYHVSKFGAYDAMYGSLGAVIVLLLWFWLSARYDHRPVPD
jgi:hypothetical protein